MLIHLAFYPLSYQPSSHCECWWNPDRAGVTEHEKWMALPLAFGLVDEMPRNQRHTPRVIKLSNPCSKEKGGRPHTGKPSKAGLNVACIIG